MYGNGETDDNKGEISEIETKMISDENMKNFRKEEKTRMKAKNYKTNQ